MLENVHVDALGNLGTTVHPPDDVLALVEKFIGEPYQPRTGHFNGAIFNLDPLWTSFEQKPQWFAFVAHLLLQPTQP